MITNIGWGTYLFFAVVNACFLPIIYFLYPETANRSLEEIDIIFAKGFVFFPFLFFFFFFFSLAPLRGGNTSSWSFSLDI